jgi:hypothetical protein
MSARLQMKLISKTVSEGTRPAVNNRSRQSAEKHLDRKLEELERKLDSLVKFNQPPFVCLIRCRVITMVE